MTSQARKKGHRNRNINRELCESTEEEVTITIFREDFMKHLASADFENIGAGQIETGDLPGRVCVWGLIIQDVTRIHVNSWWWEKRL